MRLLSFFIIFALWPAVTSAQEPLALSDLIRLAIDQNEQIAAFKARAEQKRLEAGQAKTMPNPEVEFRTGRREVNPRSGPLREISVAQPILYPGKQALRAAVLETEAEEECVRQHQTEHAVALETVRASYEYGLARRKADAVVEKLRHFESVRAFLSGRVFASPQKKAEAQIVESRLHNHTSVSFSATAEARAAFEKLNFLVQLPGDTNPTVRLIWFTGRTPLDEQGLLAQARLKNPSLLTQELEVTGARTEADMAAVEIMPDFSVSAFAQRGRAVETERNRGVGVGLSIPIFNLNKKGVAAAKARVKAEEAALSHARRRLESELRRRFAEFENARQLAARYPESRLDDMHKDFEKVEEEFRKGRVDLLIFLEVEEEIASTVDSCRPDVHGHRRH
ncbi:MAG: hypothetical protein A3G34_16790 [Candidatus Lindowbacteria bacterium RIFCSPLOWO2_12_FULL_62_27]|nr:MAG: hypothetical protein A3I06_02100 [Candidatus Lindowbacteria bacterium RIFCSPLOWO2_02_FULL_62_12]OGH62885.1 MAG: hypothetical protein A3G34_16790 [Candidatus Lindowbacteria bacterium RIFCSPLOWO2_12_FULL_62_27]